MQNDHECPYGTNYCPKVIALEDEVHDIEDDVKNDLHELYGTLDSVKRTLYVITGILMAELGVTLI